MRDHLPAAPSVNQPLHQYTNNPILSWAAFENARRRSSERTSPFKSKAVSTDGEHTTGIPSCSTAAQARRE